MAATLVWGVSSAFLRPLYPLDETRYASVAWTMQRLGSWWPMLGESPYTHKPPLLFWLMRLAWWVGGVSAPALRLLMLALTMACLWRSMTLSGALWGRRPGVVLVAALLAGCWYVAAMGTALYFDIALTLWVVLTIEGLWKAACGQRWGFAWSGCALGLGILTKGPLIGPFVIGPLLAMPWIMGQPIKGWWRGTIVTLVLAALAPLGWLVALAMGQGGDVVLAILWNQGGGRVVAAFAHARPWWWYVPLLVVLWLPWVCWPAVWRVRWRLLDEAPGRLCLAWMVPAVVLLSLISGKQPHYLLPLFPALALVLGRGLEQLPQPSPRDRGLLGPAFVFLVIALVPLLGWWLVADLRSALSLMMVLLWVAAFIVLGVLLAWKGRALSIPGQVMWLAVCALLGLSLGQPMLVAALGPRFDLRPFARVIAHLQVQGLTVAKAGAYHGQFDFLGRLEKPIHALPRDGVCAWGKTHPQGVVIVELPRSWQAADASPLLLQPYRGHQLAILPAQAACGISAQLQ